ncbi:MAG TPA: ATP-binding protein [Methanocorpusculum sp.]|nr:ATP-binding protein [Methanocorpusculum sp.]
MKSGTHAIFTHHKSGTTAMFRHITNDLLAWKNTYPRKPLILKGVRQCGKTWILKDFAAKNFKDTAYFTFEGDRTLQNIFERNLDPDRILRELSDLRRKKIDEKNTAVIFDEIQFCPNALTSLKYFCEQKPDLAILCAGSLLGTALAKPLSFPVGKVTFLTLCPMDFAEFLLANNEEYLADALAKPLSPTLVEELQPWWRDYIFTGGMPEAVLAWTKTHAKNKVDAILENILNGYELDFAKHAPAADFPKLSALWREIPNQLAKENRKFVYANVIKTGRARSLSGALEWLISAGMVYKIDAIDKPLYPLSAASGAASFKVYLCDVGLLRKMSRFPAEEIFSGAHEYSYLRGAIAENFVLTQLMAHTGDPVYYWKSGNKAEVEFVIQEGKHIIPVEVKAGTRTGGKSLAVYRERFCPEYAVRFSLKNAGEAEDEYGTLLLLPLFCAGHLKNLLAG